MKINIRNFVTLVVTVYASTIILNIAGILEVLQLNIPAKIANYFFPFLAFLSIILLSIKTNTRHLESPFIYLLLFFGCFFGVSILSTLVNQDFTLLKDIAPPYIKVVFGLFIFFWFFRNVDSLQHNQLSKSISFFFILAGLSIPLFFIIGFEIRDFNEISNLSYERFKYYVTRPSGVDGNANNASIRANMGALLCLFWIKKTDKPIHKFLLFVVFILLAISVIMTFSNTGMLTLISLITIYIYKQNYNSKKTLFRFLCGLFLILALFLYSLLQFNIDFSESQKTKIQNIYKILTLDFESINYSQRDTKAAESFNAIKENPFIGQGLGVFRNRFSSHNTYLMIIGEGGVLPFVIFAILILNGIYAGIKYKSSPRSLLILGWSAIILINSISNHNIITREYIFLPFLIYTFSKPSATKQTT